MQRLSKQYKLKKISQKRGKKRRNFRIKSEQRRIKEKQFRNKGSSRCNECLRLLNKKPILMDDSRFNPKGPI